MALVEAYRCHWCEWRWPLHPDYEVCPCCREPCRLVRIMDCDLTDEDEAHTWRLEFAFGWWLWDTGRLLQSENATR